MRLASVLTFGIRDRLEWLNTLSEHAGVGVWDAVIHDGVAAHPKSRWTWSAEFRRLCGYASKAEFPDKMASWSDLLHPDDVAPTFAAFDETIKTAVSYDICYRLRAKNGSFRWFQATGGVVKDYRGRVRRACGSLIDIHEAKTQELEQQAAVAVLIGHIRSLAEGDLLNQIPDSFPLRFNDIKSDFNSAVANLNTSMQTVAGISDSVSEGAASIRAASDDLSARTEQQAASLEETAAAIDEITSTVRKTADGANRANSIVCATRAEAEQSGEIVRSAVEAMKGIERTSSEISNIIGLIDGIAFQTNLLALNAGVEAARAGDAGRGFAVVASEVRALAQRSADAAKDVRMRILASGRQIEKGVKLVGETGDALLCIVGRIGEISKLVSEIAASSEQQANGLRQINTAVSEMDGVTQQNAAMVEEATAAASNLADEANTLRQEVGRFKLERGVSLRSTNIGSEPIQKKAALAKRRVGTKTTLAVVGRSRSGF